MKFKSVLASVAACAIAAAAMAIPASAAITNPNDGTQMTYSLNETDSNWKNISGAKVTLTMADGWEESGAGGGVVFQGDSVAWADGAKEFGFSGEGADVKNVDGVTIDASGKTITVTYDFGSAIFANASESEGWGQFIVQAWWGADFSVDNVEYVYVGGTSEESSQPEESSAQEGSSANDDSSTPADDSSSKNDAGNNGGSNNTQTTGTNTGDAGVGIAVAGLALAGAAAFAARRKH